MNSSLLVGKVRHRRARPFVYQLEHDVFYVALDLAELDEVAGRLRLVTRNRRGVLEFRDSDHLVRPATDIAVDVRDYLRADGIDPTSWQITLITNLRVIGYVFNPASFFLCRDRSGQLRVVVIEVHNTYGERHLYTLDRVVGDDVLRDEMAKEFFVSPFISLDGRYTVHIRDEDDGVRISIALREAGDQLLSTSLLLTRRPLTDRNLLRAVLRHPLMTHRTVALIHWHALRLWLRGSRFHRHAGWRQRLAAHGGTNGAANP